MSLFAEEVRPAFRCAAGLLGVIRAPVKRRRLGTGTLFAGALGLSAIWLLFH